MTSIHFYTNVPDKSAWLAHLLQKLLRQHRNATVFVQSEGAANKLGEALWRHAPTGFLANVTPQSAIASVTPVVIDWQPQTIFQDDVLFNMQPQQCAFFSRFKQLVEIVGGDEVEKVSARQRYAFYRDRGYAIKHIDMLKKSI